MSTTPSVFDLIDQCDFPVENPFELRENLFPILNTVATPSMTKLFEKTCYNSWLIYGFDGESTVSIFYDTISKKLQQGYLDNYYRHLDKLAVQRIQDNFSSIVQDELKHKEVFKAIIEKMDADNKDYRPEYFNPDCKEYVDSLWAWWDHHSLLDHLCPIVTGESYLLAAFVLFYKYTENPAKQQIFKEFIQEESRHIAHFMHFMKNANIAESERPRYHTLFISCVAQKVNFEQEKFEQFLNSLVKDSVKKQAIIKVAYNTEFHRTFRKIFLKKAWQFYSIVIPGVDQDLFERFVQDYTINSECDSKISLPSPLIAA
jgi:rubrerythrin